MVFQVISWSIFHKTILFFVKFVTYLLCLTIVCLTICDPESHLSCELGRQVETSWCRICTADRWRLWCVVYKDFDWYRNKDETFWSQILLKEVYIVCRKHIRWRDILIKYDCIGLEIISPLKLLQCSMVLSYLQQRSDSC